MIFCLFLLSAFYRDRGQGCGQNVLSNGIFLLRLVVFAL